MFRFADDLGPAKVVHVYEPTLGLRGVLVVDNVACGPSIGGLRMAPDVSTEECVRLARAMTLKNAAAGLAHGGGKSVLYGDPGMPRERKERLVRAFAHALRREDDYIFGPDMGTDEGCMAWVHDEIGRAVGLPAALGGIPLDELGATGWGLRHAAEVAARACRLELAGARVVVQGFGAVGTHTARFLADCGAILVAASDSRGTTYAPKGLQGRRQERRRLSGRPRARPRRRPRRRLRHLDPGRAARRRARGQRAPAADAARSAGRQHPFTAGAEKALHDRGVLVVPDFIANAGGVICAAMEYHGATQSAAFATIEEKVRANTEAVLEAVTARGIPPRQAALDLATARVKQAMSYRRFSGC